MSKLPSSAKNHPMFGFLCAGCGRCLEELSAWQLGAERFYCGIFCHEADLHHHKPPRRRRRARKSGRPRAGFEMQDRSVYLGADSRSAAPGRP